MKMVYQYLIKMEKKLIMINLLKNITYFIIGLYFIVAPFIYKIFIIKLPKNLNEIFIVISLFFCILYFVRLKTIIFKLLKKETKEIKIILYFKKNIVIPFQEVYMSSIINIDNYIKHKLAGPKYVGQPLLIFSKKINKIFTEDKGLQFLFCFDLLPRIILIICFIIDVFYFKQFKYIYMFGILSLIPLISTYILYTLKEFTMANIKNLCDLYILFANDKYEKISFEDVLENFKIHTFVKNKTKKNITQISLQKSVEYCDDFDGTLDFYLKELYTFTALYNHIDFLEQVKQISLYYCWLALNYIFYLVIWTYILLYFII